MFDVFAGWPLATRREACCGSDNVFNGVHKEVALRSLSGPSLAESEMLDDRGRTGGGKVLGAMRLVLRRDGRLAGGRVHDCALLLDETEAIGGSLLFPAAGCEGLPTEASCIMECCPCSAAMGDGLGLEGRTRRCGSQ